MCVCVPCDEDDGDDAETTQTTFQDVCTAEYALSWYVGRCLGTGQPAAVAAAVSLTRHFSLAAYATPSALDALEAMGHGSLADSIAACLPSEERGRYMRRLLRLGGAVQVELV